MNSLMIKLAMKIEMMPLWKLLAAWLVVTLICCVVMGQVIDDLPEVPR